MPSFTAGDNFDKGPNFAKEYKVIQKKTQVKVISFNDTLVIILDNTVRMLASSFSNFRL